MSGVSPQRMLTKGVLAAGPNLGTEFPSKMGAQGPDFDEDASMVAERLGYTHRVQDYGTFCVEASLATDWLGDGNASRCLFASCGLPRQRSSPLRADPTDG